MSILYEGNYRIIDLQKWHYWFPWKPIRLTHGGYHIRGQWRWLWVVKRQLDGERLQATDKGFPYVWLYKPVDYP